MEVLQFVHIINITNLIINFIIY